MKKYNSKIYNYVYRMVRNEETATELTQDFFIKIFKVLDKYNYQYKFTTWAFRICYNMVIDHVRKHQVQVESLDNETITPGQMVSSENYVKDDGFDSLMQDERRQYTWQVVERLPLKFRELILLRYLEELKYDEIAEITQLPVGTVKNRIFKAKEILKTEIEKDGLLELPTD